MADMHESLGMGLSYTCHGAFCTENEVYHFGNVFFKIGEDEARLMSPSQRVLLETGYEALQRSGLIRASFRRRRFPSCALINSLVYLSAFRWVQLPLVAPLQLKGCTRTPSLSSTTTPSGASERRHCQCLYSPLRPRGRAGVFRRREGPASQSFSRGSPSQCSSSLSSVRGFFSFRGWPPADPFGIRPPFVTAVSFRQRAHTIWTS